jgi:hypothetical protein
MSLTQVDGGMLSPTNGQFYGFKSKIINGAMMIDQRNAGASVSATTSAYSVDRWLPYAGQTSKMTAQQNAGSVTPPAGFGNYLGITSSSAYSVISSDIFGVFQYIEGYNIADLGWGSANAQPITLSFWVRSSLTGTFGGALRNSAADRSYPFTYTISSANTWEYKTITIPGDTSGTWLTTNGVGIRLQFGLGVGSNFSGTAGAWAAGNFISATGATSVVGTNGATFYITGVQLEKGSTATSFDYRPYGTELALCQRYCFRATSYDLGRAQDTTYPYGVLRLPVTMRASASYTASSGTFTVNSGNAGVVALVFSSVDTAFFYNSSSNWTATAFVQVSATLTAEL